MNFEKYNSAEAKAMYARANEIMKESDAIIAKMDALGLEYKDLRAKNPEKAHELHVELMAKLNALSNENAEVIKRYSDAMNEYNTFCGFVKIAM